MGVRPGTDDVLNDILVCILANGMYAYHGLQVIDTSQLQSFWIYSEINYVMCESG